MAKSIWTGLSPPPALPLQVSRPIVAPPSSCSFRPSSLRTRIHASIHSYPLASKIMVSNLPYTTDENHLMKEFSTFGQIAEVKIVKDRGSKTSRGYAFIQYTSQEHAMLALEHMDSKYFDGRVIHVDLAKLRKKDFGGYVKTCGPPSETKTSPIQEENQ
ncbi:PREDICTED: glycine-rich RNA-binding protein 4, mitochondrial [Ipomoea nil]|uniref:glycine-rich RNA-binding protein 4, mitochondrial n=1 Tax=Ipomoea nil TaxID=35883 RepID=UPI000900C54E|nr:PREDICTED: glycine-rich RNA-binding protein 4, mitochondrial [Ipomoea nil]